METSMTADMKRWGVDQWATWFETQSLPLMPRSKETLRRLDERRGDSLSPRELVPLLLSDPLLCLRVLREAEGVRSQRLGRETTTPLAAIMQLGIEHCKESILSADEVVMNQSALLAIERRCSIAAHIALHWAIRRHDVNPTEVAMAALLVDAGELLLWLHAPELPRAAIAEMLACRASRTAQAQAQACGFEFRQLTIQCCEIWNLPRLLGQLLRGEDSDRARLTGICSNIARHLVTVTSSSCRALADDLVEAHALMSFANFETMASDLPGLSEDERRQVVEIAQGAEREEGAAERFMATNPFLEYRPQYGVV